MNIKVLIGRNLARLRFGKDYIAIISFLITAISTMSIFLDLTFELFFILLFISILLGWIIGYILDKKEIIIADRTTTAIQNLKVQKIIWESIYKEILIPKIKILFKELIKDINQIENKTE